MIPEMAQMPTAAWNAYYDQDGNLMEGVVVTGEDAVLAALMRAWDKITEAESAAELSDQDGMEVQNEAADELETIASTLREMPVSQWRTESYISAPAPKK